jgi:mRNA-degrading endonuclease RelE of RelBE toxin-antitoxin system
LYKVKEAEKIVLISKVDKRPRVYKKWWQNGTY